MNFIIQGSRGVVQHDFCYTMVEACRFYNWFRAGHNPDHSRYVHYIVTNKSDSPQYKQYLPIGSVEYVEKKLLAIGRKLPPPINIPQPLLDPQFTDRHVFYGTEKDVKVGKPKFVKDMTKIKAPTNILDSVPPGSYLISDIIDLRSEWRVFVFEKKVVGVHPYCSSPDYSTYPNIDTILAMIDAWIDQPVACTIDVGVTANNKTVIIECHDFFSCGLYGFSNYDKLILMHYRWWRKFLDSPSST